MTKTTRVEEVKELLELMEAKNLTELTVGDIHLTREAKLPNAAETPEVNNPALDKEIDENLRKAEEYKRLEQMHNEFQDILFAHQPLYQRFILPK